MNHLLPVTLAIAAALACSAATAQSDTLAKIKSSGAITIGARDSQIPFSYKPMGSGDPVGFTNDICLKVVDAVKAQLALPRLEVRYMILNSTNRIPLLTNGSVDLDCATTTNTQQRQQQVAFAPSHFVTNITAAVKKNSGINTLADLNGKTVSTVAGSTGVQLLRGYRKSGNIEVQDLAAKDTADGFLMMASGRTAAYILDDIQLAGLIATSPNAGDFKILTQESLRQEPYGIMYRKDDPQLASLIQDSFRLLAEDGEIERQYTRWFLRRLPSGTSIDLPMSPQLEAILQTMAISKPQ